MEWNIVVGAVCAVCGAVLTYLAFSRNKRKDDQQDGRQTGVILTEVGYIKNSVDSINRKLDQQDERNLEFMSRLTAVEESSKQAHKRIDRLEGREA